VTCDRCLQKAFQRGSEETEKKKETREAQICHAFDTRTENKNGEKKKTLSKKYASVV